LGALIKTDGAVGTMCSAADIDLASNNFHSQFIKHIPLTIQTVGLPTELAKVSAHKRDKLRYRGFDGKFRQGWFAKKQSRNRPFISQERIAAKGGVTMAEAG
jgi:hypothetical protein